MKQKHRHLPSVLPLTATVLAWNVLNVALLTAFACKRRQVGLQALTLQ